MGVPGGSGSHTPSQLETACLGPVGLSTATRVGSPIIASLWADRFSDARCLTRLGVPAEQASHTTRGFGTWHTPRSFAKRRDVRRRSQMTPCTRSGSRLAQATSHSRACWSSRGRVAAVPGCLTVSFKAATVVRHPAGGRGRACTSWLCHFLPCPGTKRVLIVVAPSPTAECWSCLRLCCRSA